MLRSAPLIGRWLSVLALDVIFVDLHADFMRLVEYVM